MDKNEEFVQAMLKSAKEKRTVRSHTPEVDVEEIERITKDIQNNIKKDRK